MVGRWTGSRVPFGSRQAGGLGLCSLRGSVKLERFFIVELEDLLEDGVLKSDDLSALEELCESLHISEERAEEILTETVKKRASGGVLQAAADMRGGANDGAVKELMTVIKYASVLGDVKAQCSVSSAERSELCMLFQASHLTSGMSDVERQEQVEVLKSVMGLAEAIA